MLTFPISRQSMYGSLVEDESMFLLLADWTSAEEKDKFEPGKGRHPVSISEQWTNCQLPIQESVTSP